MSSTPRKLLAIGYVWPEPNSSAAGSHMMNLLSCFQAAGYEVIFASPAVRGEHKVDLTAIGIEEIEITLNCSSFDTFVKNLAPDVVLFDRFMMEEQFGWRVAMQCPQALRVLDTEDLHFLREARHQGFKQNLTINDGLLKNPISLREVAAIFRSDLSLIISEYELQLLVNSFAVPMHILQHCPFMLEPQIAPDNLPSFEQRQHFICIGNFRHAPNWDAVLWLKQQIWPMIRAQLPQAELHIYGAYPPPKATQLHQPKTGFFVDGWTKDAKAVMAQSRVCLAPLRFGAGLKGKLAEAMQCGTPSVTTTIGAEGMHGELDWPGAVCDDAQDIAQQAVNLCQQADTWALAQQHGYTILKQRFNGEVIRRNLIAKIEELRNNLSTHRQANFIGLMLQHHQHKSTQYMAQWIEAKNKK